MSTSNGNDTRTQSLLPNSPFSKKKWPKDNLGTKTAIEQLKMRVRQNSHVFSLDEMLIFIFTRDCGSIIEDANE